MYLKYKVKVLNAEKSSHFGNWKQLISYELLSSTGAETLFHNFTARGQSTLDGLDIVANNRNPYRENELQCECCTVCSKADTTLDCWLECVKSC